jgi:hypothetical protein
MVEDGRGGDEPQSLQVEGLNVLETASPLPEKPAYVVFHEAVQALGLYEQIAASRRTHIIAYFTTDSSYTDLLQQGIASSSSEAGYLITTGVRTLFEHLPPELQVQYQSPEAIMELKTKGQELSSKRRTKLREAWKNRVPHPIGPFTDEHTRHIKEAALRRWKRLREQRALQESQPAEEHIVFLDPSEQP